MHKPYSKTTVVLGPIVAGVSGKSAYETASDTTAPMGERITETIFLGGIALVATALTITAVLTLANRNEQHDNDTVVE